MCDFCDGSKTIKSFGVPDAILVGTELRLNYSAYSCDSSFSFEDASIEIGFCPFCGTALTKKKES